MNQSNNFFGQHIFSQVAALCNRSQLREVITESKSDRYYKHLLCYEHLISMLYCVLSGCTSLREIVSGLAIAQGKLNHLGIQYVPPRSTLSDGNKKRSANVFRNIYFHLYQRYRPSLSDSRLPKAIIQKLFLVDSTVFGLFKAILKISSRPSLNGKVKGGIKKNTIIEGSTLMPCFVQFSAATVNDQQIYKVLSLPKDSYVVFDRGYSNRRQFANFTQANIRFVTRLKENEIYDTEFICIHEQPLPPNGVLSEQSILMYYKDDAGAQKTLRLRYIRWWDEKHGIIELLTNDFELPPHIIVQLYRYRWQIELFFKKLKQNFPLQYFVGDNQNAIEIQIWCALIALLLLSVLHQHNRSKLAFTVFATIIRLHLFTYMNVRDLLYEYQIKRIKAPPNQNLSLFNSS
jgi:hypothetical protein